MMTGELKAKCIEVLQKFVADFQAKKNAVSKETLDYFMDSNRKIEI